MSQSTDLTNHIMALIEQDTGLLGELSSKWFYFGVPQTFPSIYLDGLYLVDDKLDTWNFNISFATNDMSLEGLETAKQVRNALQASNCIHAQSILVRPEPENKRTRYLIPCSAFLYALSTN